MTTPTPNRAQDHVYGDRLLTWFESHPKQWQTLVDNGIERFDLELKFEAWLDDRAREAAMNRHPAKGKRRECTPPEWQPTPDPIHWAPRMSNWDIVRDLLAVAWKAVRR